MLWSWVLMVVGWEGLGGAHRSPFTGVEGPKNGGWLLSLFENCKAIEAGVRCGNTQMAPP